MRDLLSLSADELRDEAKRLAKPRGRGGHWSEVALVLGRVHDERLWSRYVSADGVLYDSWREYAHEELGLPGDEAVTLVKLWELIRRARDVGVPLDQWSAVTKSRALAIRRVVDAGANPRDALAWAERYPTTADLDRAVRMKLGGKEVWERLTIAMPDSVAQLFRASLVLAIRELDDDAITPDRIEDRDVMFRLVEMLARSYVTLNVAGDGRNG